MACQLSGSEDTTHFIQEIKSDDAEPPEYICQLCNKRFPISMLLFEHQVTHHRKQKISISLRNLVEAETCYSSDSDCEYTISVEIVKRVKYKNSAQEEEEKDCDVSENAEIKSSKGKCLYCSQSFTSAKNLRQHIKMYHVKETGTIELELSNLKVYTCPECSKELRDQRCLKKHLKLCHNLVVNGLVYNSTHKSRTLAGPSVVRSKMANDYPIIRDRSPTSGKPRTKCGICGHGPVYGYTTILKHQMRKHGRPKKEFNESYVCGHCSKEFGNKENLTRHMKSHENARRYHCDMCPARFNTAILLRRHKVLHVYIHCGICNKEFQFRRQYQTHHRKQHPNMKKVVQMIQETSKNEIIVSNQVPKVSQVEFHEECFKCSKVFKSKRGFKDHVCRSPQTEFYCNMTDCKYVGFDEAGLRSHKASEHGIVTSKAGKKVIEVRNDACTSCGKVFKSKKGYQHHRCKSVQEILCPLQECNTICQGEKDYYKHVEEFHRNNTNLIPMEIIQDIDDNLHVVENEIVVC